MEKFGSVDQILDFAIAREEESFRFYTDLAGRMTLPWVRQLFEDFAREEQGHRAKLLAIKQGRLLAREAKKVTDLKIGDYLVDVEPTAEMDYQQALVLAMKKEKAAFKLYVDLARIPEDSVLKGTFLTCAQEEAMHKLRFEIEYDENVLTEN